MTVTTSAKRIIIPDGMRKAVGLAIKGVDPDGYYVYSAVEAVLQWIISNPVLPTEEDTIYLDAEWAKRCHMPALFWEWAYQAIQCRIFRVFEPQVPIRVDRALRGITLTPEQADAIHDLVNQCTEPRKESAK